MGSMNDTISHWNPDNPLADLGQSLGQSPEQSPGQSSLWEIRTEEQDYAFLRDTDIPDTNRYGQKIDLIDLTEARAPVGRSININDNPEVGCNLNRNKQHGFYFNADNCIGCHACESACAEKNDTPAHLAFRSVGYVEGGSYPDYLRLNISMACNHCDDPVCLKGCPTGAYTKLAEFGAVLQDPDTCFGCGYCTWVCPYNAPQLDPVKGEVSKCNMCVDRLEVGLKPACVSACVGNALDFGVIEDIPDNRFQAEITIPGFPDPEITHPNIRFQQVRKLPEEMKRTDSAPVKYHKKSDGTYKPEIDRKQDTERFWNIKRLSSHENPLVLFTLATQASIGAFLISFLGTQLGISGFEGFATSLFYPALLMASLGLVSLGLFLSTTHLGKPLRFYRGFNNLRYSPVCREGLGIAVYMGFLALHLGVTLLLSSPVNSLVDNMLGIEIAAFISADILQTISLVFGGLAMPSALIGLYYMNRCYRIPARPFWNHWQVVTSFFGNSLSLGAILCGTFLIASLLFSGEIIDGTILLIGTALVGGLLFEGIGLFYHERDMSRANHEGGASHYVQTTTFGKTYLLRNGLIVSSIAMGLTMLGLSYLNIIPVSASIALLAGIASITVMTSLIGRALFYILVIPTTMPGAFFWKNKGFEAHARDIGLADMPQVGVAPSGH